MKFTTVFKICRSLSYVLELVIGAAAVTLFMFDPERSADEYVNLVYGVLIVTILISCLLRYVMYDITRITRYAEPLLVCVCAFIYQVCKKTGHTPTAKLLSNSHDIYFKCNRSYAETFNTCVNLYDRYVKCQLSKEGEK